ncbi:MAG: hypothetical protein EOO40_04660 [Deltaproteobacteria bacterium]|nr:MAG: hypothetical protein EOO40_04660 [Deltaproteobacteria bacterium]
MIATQTLGLRLQQAYQSVPADLPQTACTFGKNALGGIGVCTAAAFMGLEGHDDTGLTMAIGAGLSTSLWGAARSVCHSGGLLRHGIDVIEAASFAYLAGGIGYSIGDSHGRGTGPLRGAVLGTLGAIVLGSGAAAGWLKLCHYTQL